MIVGQDTDSESNLLEAAMPWIVKNDKPGFDFIGKWATQHVADRGLQWMLVGFESPTGAMPVEGGQVVVDGKSSGRVTSVRHSAELGKIIGLAIVPYDPRGRRWALRRPGERPPGPDDGAPRPVLRSRRSEGEVVSALDFLSVDAAADWNGIHPVAKSAVERAQRDAGATFEERDGWLVPVSIPGEQDRLAQVGIADLSHLTKLEVRPAGESPALDPDGRLVSDLHAARARALSSATAPKPCALSSATGS